jgi:hypothetical protein
MGDGHENVLSRPDVRQEQCQHRPCRRRYCVMRARWRFCGCRAASDVATSFRRQGLGRHSTYPGRSRRASDNHSVYGAIFRA